MDIKARWSNLGFTQEACDLMWSSLAPSTITQYDYALRKWASFCNECSKDQSDFSEINIVNFLSSLKGKFNYSTIAGCRAALSTFMSLSGQQTTNLPLVERVMKGIFRANPPRPKYSNIWRVDTVLQLITSWGENINLPLKELTFKTVMLVALASPKRCSELAVLKLSCAQFSEERVILHVDKMNKNRGVGQKAQSVTLEKIDASLLCPVECLRFYLTRTEPLRGKTEEVFISYSNPYGPISASTIGRWIKQVLTMAGIENFGAHSTRAASTSWASHKGVSIQDIMSAASWSEKGCTFERFYKKNIRSNDFQKAVLSAP